MTLALRVLAAKEHPDLVPGSVLRLPQMFVAQRRNYHRADVIELFDGAVSSGRGGHCTVDAEGIVEDGGSDNGTWIERGGPAGRVARPTQLAVGDVLAVGHWRFALVDVLDVWDGAYSYGQIMVFDAGAEMQGNWTERHFNQGFLRNDRHLSLGTLPEAGHVLVRAFSSPYVPLAENNRVIAVPFRVTSGHVRVTAPDEVLIGEHDIALPVGDYRLVTCQRFFEGDNINGDQDLDLFFERVDLPRQRSEILVADRDLRPELPLLETDR